MKNPPRFLPGGQTFNDPLVTLRSHPSNEVTTLPDKAGWRDVNPL